MINFKIIENPYRVHLDFNSSELNYPLDVLFINQGGSIFWQTKIENAFSWVEGPSHRELNVRVIDSFGDLIFSNNWLFNNLSDRVEITFINWCRDFILKNSKKPKGIVIGTHDGTSGEWVEAYNQNLIGDCTLIEPNINPFLRLTCNYKNENFKFKRCVISESDDYVDFYTDKNGESESSSVLESNYSKHLNDGMKKIKIKSYNPNTIMMNDIPDWLHIDAEGYDGKIILMINDDILNNLNFIIWEHIHLDEQEKEKINLKLLKNGFKIEVGDGYNTCAYKNYIK